MICRSSLFAAALACAAAPASACEVMHLLEMTEGSGEAHISLNDAYVQKMGGEKGYTMTQFRSWLVEGRNVVTIEHLGEGSAEFELQWGCKGAFPEEKPKETVVFAGPGQSQVTFEQDAPVDEIYLEAEDITEDNASTLVQAAMNFRKAVERRDADTVIRYAEPMFREATRQEFPVEMLENMIRQALERGEMTIRDGVWAERVAGGNILQFVSEDFEPMIEVVVKEDGSTLTMPFGTFWGRFNGEWRVAMN